MRERVAVVALLFGLSAQAASAQIKISGGGASGASSVIAAWSKAFSAKGGATVEYASSNSLSGVEAVKKGQADFGLSEARISLPELQAGDLVQFPVLVEGVVPVINLPGVSSVRLTGPVLADIFLGKIKTWDDPALRALNPTTALPGTAIKVLHRESESGTSFLFTHYLSAVSAEWKSKVGAGAVVKWPAGEAPVKAGGDGMADQVASTPGAIGYVDFARATKRKLASPELQNKSGKWLAASAEGFAAAAANVDWTQAPTFGVIIVDQPGATTWPIAGVCFAVTKRVQADAAKGRAMLQYFEYGLTDGTAATSELGYVPVPAPVVKIVRESWPRMLKTTDGASLLPGAAGR